MIGIEYLEIGKHITAFIDKPKNRKNPIYELCNRKKELIHLGEIKWNVRWREYCFYPIDGTVFDDECLLDIVNFLKGLNGGYNEK